MIYLTLLLIYLPGAIASWYYLLKYGSIQDWKGNNNVGKVDMDGGIKKLLLHFLTNRELAYLTYLPT